MIVERVLVTPWVKETEITLKESLLVEVKESFIESKPEVVSWKRMEIIFKESEIKVW